MNLYIATFKNGESENDVVWFMAEEDEKYHVAEKTVRDWECLDDEFNVVINDVYQIDYVETINQCSNRPEKRVYVIDMDKTSFDFRGTESKGDDESIIAEAERLGLVYSLEYFQDEVNDENINLNNSFILIR